MSSKSMILWIMTNRCMSLFHKLKRLLVFLSCLIQRHLGRQVSLVAYLLEGQPSSYNNLLNNIERLKRKGWSVRLEIVLIDKKSLNELKKIQVDLKQLKDQKVQHKQLLNV